MASWRHQCLNHSLRRIIRTTNEPADTFVPFKSGIESIIIASQASDNNATQGIVLDYTVSEDIECCIISTLSKGSADFQAPAHEILFYGSDISEATYESLWTSTWFETVTSDYNIVKMNARTELLMIKNIKAGTRIICRVLPRNPGNPSHWNITTTYRRGVLIKLA